MTHSRKINQSALIELGCAVALALLPVYSMAGGDISGGGTAVVPPNGGKPVSLDLFLAKPDLIDSYRFKNDMLEKRYNYSEDYRVTECDPRLPSPKKSNICEGVHDRLRTWSKTSPIIAAALEKAVRRLDFVFVRPDEERRIDYDGYYFPNRTSYPGYKTITVAKYFGGYHPDIPDTVLSPAPMTVHVRTSLWLALGDLSKQSVVLHEALRRIQKDYDGNFSEQFLQEMTARLALANPDALPSLDDPSYLGASTEAFMLVGAPFRLLCPKLQEFVAHCNHPVVGQIAAEYCETIPEPGSENLAHLGGLDIRLYRAFFQTPYDLSVSCRDEQDHIRLLASKAARIHNY